MTLNMGVKLFATFIIDKNLLLADHRSVSYFWWSHRVIWRQTQIKSKETMLVGCIRWALNQIWHKIHPTLIGTEMDSWFWVTHWYIWGSTFSVLVTKSIVRVTFLLAGKTWVVLIRIDKLWGSFFSYFGHLIYWGTNGMNLESLFFGLKSPFQVTNLTSAWTP